MSAAAFYILTTQGPVAIQRISEEDPAVSSVICLDGLTQILPISPAYDAFVRRPAGVIERMSGHGSYRMDVAARIDEGRSWQLAAFLAHAARMMDASPSVTVFATGEVDRSLCVREVEHVAQKLEALEAFLDENEIATDEAVILVPMGTSAVPERLGGVQVIPVASVPEAADRVKITIPPVAEEHVRATDSRSPDRPRRGQSLPVLLGAALIAAVLFWIGGDFARWSGLFEQGRILELESDLNAAEESAFGRLRAAGYRGWLDVSRTEAPVGLEGVLIAAGEGGACTETGKLQKLALTDSYAGDRVICGVEVRGIGADDTVLIGRLGYWPDGLGHGVRPARVMRGSREASGRVWSLEFETPPKAGAALRLVVISGAVDIRGPQPWYQDLLAAPRDSPVFAAAKGRLMRLGFHVSALDWQRE